MAFLAATPACTVDGNGRDGGLFGGGPSGISASGQATGGDDAGAATSADTDAADSAPATRGDGAPTDAGVVDTGSAGSGTISGVSTVDSDTTGDDHEPARTESGDPAASSEDDATESSTGEIEVGTQPAFGEYSHCLSNAACNVGSCMTLGMPVSDGYCALTCGFGGSPAPCADAPPGSPLSPTCYGADNGRGGAVYVCALGCADDQPCPDGMECFSVPQAAAAGGGNVEFCA